MNTPDFRQGVVYSRGPLVSGIVRGLFWPSLILALVVGGYVWVKLKNERNRTLTEIASGLESRVSRDRWLAAFELSQKLTVANLRGVETFSEKEKTERNEIQQKLLRWVSDPHYTNDPILMRYTALLAGNLYVDSELTVVRKLALHQDPAVRLAAYSVAASDAHFAPKNLSWFSAALHDHDANVRGQTLQALASTQAVWSKHKGRAGLVSRIRELAKDPALDIRWNALLLMADLDWVQNRDSLLLLLDPETEAFKALGTPVLRPFVFRTLGLLGKHGDEVAVRDAILHFSSKVRDHKLKKASEALLGAFAEGAGRQSAPPGNVGDPR